METIRKTDSRRGRIAYEVAGLAWLAEASDPGAAVVPVLDHGSTWLEEPRLVSVSPTPRASEDFGRALAHTHAAGASHLGAPPPGFEGDGWMGEAPLSLPSRPRARGEEDGANRANRANPDEATPASSPRESWGSFYARERIAPYVDDRTFTAAERALLQELATAIIVRSARIVAATYVAIIQHRMGENELENQFVAVDGSVYEKVPLVAHHLRGALDTLLLDEAVNVKIILENAGSALGAALAAAMTEKN